MQLLSWKREESVTQYRCMSCGRYAVTLSCSSVVWWVCQQHMYHLPIMHTSLMLQIEGLQQQLSQAVSARRMAEADALRRGATLKQLEHRLGELSSEKDVSIIAFLIRHRADHHSRLQSTCPTISASGNNVIQAASLDYRASAGNLNPVSQGMCRCTPHTAQRMCAAAVHAVMAAEC